MPAASALSGTWLPPSAAMAGTPAGSEAPAADGMDDAYGNAYASAVVLPAELVWV